MLINWCIEKLNVVYPHNGILFSHKRMKYWYMLQHELWKHYATWRKPVTKNFIWFHLYERSISNFQIYNMVLMKATMHNLWWFTSLWFIYLFYIWKFVLFDSFTHCANTLLAASGNRLAVPWVRFLFFFRFHI